MMVICRTVVSFFAMMLLLGMERVKTYDILHSDYCPQSGQRANGPQYLLLGLRDSPNFGIGNILAFFPAAYFYALFTNRQVMIWDESYLGEFCRVVRCGFPFYSTVKESYEDLIGKIDLQSIPGLRHQQFLSHLGNNSYTDVIITATGMDSKSEWFAWQVVIRQCLAMLTGCAIGDVGCAERYAYQKLVVGPFKNASKIAPRLIPQIKGLPDSMRKAILNLPWQYAARLDVTLHLRNQFSYFENEMDPSHATAQEEVQTWLKSPECAAVFHHMAEAARHKIAQHLSHKTESTAHLSHIDSVYVYVAGDSEAVKQALRLYLMQYDQLSNTTMRVVTVHSPGIYHIKGHDQIRECCGGLGLTYLVLDWYLMSLSNVIYAWRKGGTKGYSTFIGTARKISGTREPTVVGEGRSVGTMAYQLVQGRNGYHFDQIHIWGGVSID